MEEGKVTNIVILYSMEAIRKGCLVFSRDQNVLVGDRFRSGFCCWLLVIWCVQFVTFETHGV